MARASTSNPQSQDPSSGFRGTGSDQYQTVQPTDSGSGESVDNDPFRLLRS